MEIFWGIHSATLLWRVWPAPWFHQQDHIHGSCLKYVQHMPLVGYWILCMKCAEYMWLLVFCGPGQHSEYSDLLWASLGCGIYHLPLSSAEVKGNVELYLYSPCRPWTFYFFFFKLFICLGRVAIVPLAEWSWVQILVGTKDFSLLQNIQTNSGCHPAGLPAWRSPLHITAVWWHII